MVPEGVVRVSPHPSKIGKDNWSSLGSADFCNIKSLNFQALEALVEGILNQNVCIARNMPVCTTVSNLIKFL